MGLTLPYGQNHYMGEYATEGAALTWIRGNKWDSVGDGSGNPKAGMAFFDTAVAKIKVHDGSAWAALGSAAPGGSSGQIQYNNSSVFGGASQLYWDSGNAGLAYGKTTVDGSRIDVVTVEGTYPYQATMHGSNQNYGCFVSLRKARGSQGSETTVADGDPIGGISFRGYGSAYTTVAAIKATVSGTVSGNNIPTKLDFQTHNGTALDTRMTVTSAGNVFIGSTAGYSFNGTVLNYSLQISGADSSPFTVGIVQEAAGTQTRFNGYRCNGSLATKTAVASGDILFANNGSGWDGGLTPTYVPAGFMQIIVDGAVAEDSVPGRIIFNTRPVGSTSGPAERMRISNDGKVSIATTTPSSALLTLGLAGTTAGSISLAGLTSGTCTVQVAAAAGAGTIFQLPATNGTSGQYLQTNGFGVTSWVTATAGAAGSTGWVQYNNGGALAAESGFAWDTTLKQVMIANNDIDTGLRITVASTTDKFPVINFVRYRNSIASPSAVQNNDALGVLGFIGRGTTNMFSGAYIAAYAAGNFSDTSSPAYVVIRTAPSGSTLTVERFRITSDGKLSTGAETAPDVDSGGLCLNHGTGTGSVITFKNTTVSHPFTGYAEADTYARVVKADNTYGGLAIESYAGASSASAMYISGCLSTPHTGDTGIGVINLNFRKTDGGTGGAVIANTDVGISFRNHTTVKAVLMGSGDFITQAGLKIGAYGQTAAAGAIEWNGTNFRGYTGSVWKNLDASGGTTVDAGTAQGQVLFWNNGGSAWTHSETSEWVWDDTNKRVGINVAAPSSRLDVGGDVEIASDAWHYYGDPTTDGSWRTGRVSADLVVQKRESGTWTTKHTFV